MDLPVFNYSSFMVHMNHTQFKAAVMKNKQTIHSSSFTSRSLFFGGFFLLNLKSIVLSFSNIIERLNEYIDFTTKGLGSFINYQKWARLLFLFFFHY